MPNFSCPRCGAMNHAPTAAGLVCYACGYGNADPGAPERLPPGTPAADAPPAWKPVPVEGPSAATGCPHCRTPLPPREKIATWALVLGIVLTVVTFCPLFLLFFLAKERDCPVCGYRYA